MPSKNVKKRNWAFIVYPDSLPDDWLELLQLTGLPCAISPLHDRDFNADGEQKKPHYHVMVCYSGPTSYNVVRGLTEQLNAPVPKPLESVRGYYRYLTHLDNPEKAQYSDSDIALLNGFNISDFVELSKSEVLQYKKKLQDIIRQSGIYEYSDFMDMLLDSDMTTEYDVASSNTFFFEKYISSRRNKMKILSEKNEKSGRQP